MRVRVVLVFIGVAVREAGRAPAPARPVGAEPPIRGREHELRRVDGLIRALRDGRSGALVIRGEAGAGSSRLLREAAATASAAGLRVAVVDPEPDARLLPLAALLDAVTTGPDPIVAEREVGSLIGVAEVPYALVVALHAAFERAAASGVLVVVDDLHRLDPGTLAVLRALVRRLAGRPVGWLVAVRSGIDEASVLATLETLGGDDVAVEPAPLGADAARALLADLLGGEPDATVLAVAERADRLPALLVELARGLVDERLVDLVDGRAVVPGPTVPSGFGASVRERLRTSSPAARQVLQVGALLGDRFAARPLGVLLGDRPAELVSGLREALAAGLLLEDGDGFRFRHGVVREVAASSLPRTIRRLVARRAIDELLGEGEALLGVVDRLAEVVDPGDRDGIALIRDGALELAASDLRRAVDLAGRALVLADGSPDLPGLLGDLAPVLWAGGCADEVLRRARRIKVDLGASQTARLALVVARLQSESSTTAALRTLDWVLRMPAIAGAGRARLLATQALNLAHAGEVAGIRDVMAEAGRLAEAASDVSVVATLEATESVLAFYESRFDDADRWITSANSRIAGLDDADSPTWLPEGLWLACLAVSLGDRTRTMNASEPGRSTPARSVPLLSGAAWIQVQARMLLDRGRVAEARALAESVVAHTDGGDPETFMAVTAGQILFRIALVTADRPAADRYRHYATTLHHAEALHRAGHWLLALEAESRGDRDAVLAHTDDAWRTFALPVASMSNPPDFADDVALVRMMLRAGLPDRVEVIDRAAAQRSAANPSNDLCAGVAHHVGGLARASREDLAAAVRRFRSTDRPILLASALEDLGRRIQAEGGDGACVPWSEAEALYAAAGATRGQDRVRRRLRDIGVHRRGAGPVGESDLTHREHQVVERVAAGLTTPEIASDLSISTHTVVTHVRHVYAKWDVRTRRELRERFARERRPSP